MRKATFNNLISIFVAVVFYSCTASTVTKDSDISFRELKTRVNTNAMKLRSLDADGEISIESPTISNTGSITVSIQKPDSVFTKLEGPFGVDVANLLITRNNFIYYNVMDNKVITGPSSQRNLGIILRVKLEFDDFINAFSGKYTFNDSLENAEVVLEDNNYLVTMKLDKEVRKYWVNAEDFYVTKIGSYDKDGKTKLEVLYENFYQSDDIFFPKKITINRPKENQNIWLSYHTEKFNQNKLSYKLKIPKSARKINW